MTGPADTAATTVTTATPSAKATGWLRRCLGGGLLAAAMSTTTVSGQHYDPMMQPPPVAAPHGAAGYRSAAGSYGPGIQPSPVACPPTSYEQLPPRGAAFARLFSGSGQSPLSGLYGRIEYLAFRIDDSSQRLGRLLPDFDPRAARGVLSNDLPALPAFALFGLSPLTANSLGDANFEDDFLIDNPIAATGLFASEPFVAEVNRPELQFGGDVTSGIRGTVGLPFRFGLIEASVWGMDQESTSDRFTFTPAGNRPSPVGGRGFGINTSRDLDPTDSVNDSLVTIFENDTSVRELVGIPLVFTDAVPLDPTLFVDDSNIIDVPSLDRIDAPRQGLAIFDLGFEADQSTELNGAGADILWTLRDGDSVRIYGITGFEYTQLDDSFRLTARRSAVLNSALGGAGVEELARVNADTFNRYFMGCLGFRSTFDMGPIRLGVQPRVGLGGSRREAETFSSNLTQNSGGRSDSVSESVFAATFDLSVDARVQLREWLAVNVGYEVGYLGDAYRPSTVLDYTTVSSDPQVSATGETTDFSWQTFFVGCEVIIP